MQNLAKPLALAVVAAACSLLVACGGASTASAYADELNEPTPASATHGSTLADLTDTRSAP